MLKHGGDFRLATKALAAQGYGEQLQTHGDDTATLVLAEDYLAGIYDFRYNTITQKIEFKNKQTTQFSVMSDFELNSFFRDLHANGILIGIDVLSRLLHSDFVGQYDPFKEYFSTLPAWDGKDYIAELAKTVTLKDPSLQALFHDCLKRWLIAATACSIEDKITNQNALILVGEQGKLKTTWLNGLVPSALSDYRFVGTINPDNKDTLVYLSECFLINLDELETLRKAEIGSLKTIMTLDKIKIRKPYDRESSTLPRRASFVGSINNREFLNDPSGSRRFLVFEIEAINAAHGIDMDGVYAQAISLHKSGEKHWFDQDEIRTINERNKEYEVLTTEDELVQEYFEPAQSGAVATYTWTSTEVAKYFSKEDVGLSLSSQSAAKFGSALKRCGFTARKSNGKKVYDLKLRQGFVSSNWNQLAYRKTEPLQVEL
jgi:predicted P-loop ATPase